MKLGFSGIRPYMRSEVIRERKQLSEPVPHAAGVVTYRSGVMPKKDPKLQIFKFREKLKFLKN